MSNSNILPNNNTPEIFIDFFNINELKNFKLLNTL